MSNGDSYPAEIQFDTTGAAAGSNRNILKFIDEIRDYAEIKELDEAILHRLIKKIIIGEKQVIDGQKVQDVTIIYNFVGQIA